MCVIYMVDNLCMEDQMHPNGIFVDPQDSIIKDFGTKRKLYTSETVVMSRQFILLYFVFVFSYRQLIMSFVIG